MHLTPLTTKDIPTAITLQRAAVKALCVGEYGADVCNQWAAAITPADFAQMDAGQYYKWEEDGTLIAIGGWEEDNLKLFYLAPKYVGQGLAAQFFRTLEGKYLQQKPQVWHVLANLTAVAFYLKMGFEKIRSYTLTLKNGTKLPVMMMTKRYAQHA